MPKHAPRGPIKAHGDPMAQPDPMGGRCTAHSKQTGQPCRQRAIPGGTVCHYHGGAAPQVKFKAMERYRALQPKAVQTLETLLDRSEFPTVQMAAIRDVMDRTEGKAAESTNLKVEGGMTIRHVLGDDD